MNRVERHGLDGKWKEEFFTPTNLDSIVRHPEDNTTKLKISAAFRCTGMMSVSVEVILYNSLLQVNENYS